MENRVDRGLYYRFNLILTLLNAHFFLLLFIVYLIYTITLKKKKKFETGIFF